MARSIECRLLKHEDPSPYSSAKSQAWWYMSVNLLLEHGCLVYRGIRGHLAPIARQLNSSVSKPCLRNETENAQKTRKQVQYCRHIARTMKSDSSDTESPRRSACYLVWSTWNRGQWEVTYNDRSWQSGFWLERGEDASWKSIYRNLLMHWKSGYRSKIFDGGMCICVKVYWTVLYTY